MITVKDLAKKLTAYAAKSPEAANTEVMMAFDHDVAFPFLRGDDHHAMGLGGLKRFLVLIPHLKGDRLVLKGRE